MTTPATTTATAATSKEPKVLKELDTATANLSAKFEQFISIDHTTGQGDSGKGNLFNDHLPENLTPEIITAVNDYRTMYVAAAAHVFGKKSITAMEANPALESTNIQLPYGDKDTLNGSVDREYHNHLQGTTSYGHITMKPVHRAAKASSGQLGLVRQHIGQMAMAALKKD